jgi:pimeloyl-ACP methyl ester carboxylesterase
MILHSILTLLLLVLLSMTNVLAQTTSSVETFSVNLRPNVRVQMGATVISKSGSQKHGRSILVLNATAHTSESFVALAQSVIASDANVSKMILLDHPGHGNSGFPVGGSVKFGDLTMDDYVTALLGSLEELKHRHIKPTAILGHSLGAEIIQMAQTRLVNEGDSLRHAFGIRSAIFIAPDIAGPLPWAAIDFGAADPLAAAFIRNDPTLGNVFDLLTMPGGPETWVSLFYGDRMGTIVAGAPTPAQAIANGFISMDSGAMAKQLIGLPSTPGGPRTPRPTINANIFSKSKGTIAGVITLEQDALYIFPTEHKALYRFITGDQTDNLFFAFTGSDKVHYIHTVIPGIYNGVIKSILLANHGHNNNGDDDDDDEN